MATHWVVGDTVLIESARKGKWYGYALLHDDESVFYIGIASDPSSRLRAHVYAGTPRVRQHLARCKLKRMRILAGPMSESDAREWEKASIRAHLELGTELANQEAHLAPAGTSHQRHPAVLRFAGLSKS